MRSARSLVASRASHRAFKPAFLARPGCAPAPAGSLAFPSGLLGPAPHCPCHPHSCMGPEGAPIPRLCSPQQGRWAHTLRYFCS